MSAAESERLSCLECGRSFARREHLKRHAAVHDAANAFACRTCSKRFTRSDILTRHETTHLVSINGRKQKKFRSCAPCVLAKTRCSSHIPCTRCAVKKIDCYPQPHATGSTSLSKDSSQTTHVSPSSTNLDCMSPLTHDTFSPTSVSSPIRPGQGFGDFPTADTAQSLLNETQIENQDYENARSTLNCFSPSAEPRRREVYTNRLTLELDNAIGSTRGIPSAHLSADLQSNPPTPQARELYIDSYGARLPKIRRATTKRANGFRAYDREHISFPLSRPSSPDLEDESLRGQVFMLHSTWQEMKANFERCCLSPSPIFPSFSSSHFPTREDFNDMIAAYFDTLHHIVPVVHLFSLESSNWILMLSLASLGARFLDGMSKFELVIALQEFLQRALVLIAEKESSDLDSMVTTAKQLHCIGLMFSEARDLRLARRWRADLAASFKELVVSATAHPQLNPSREDDVVHLNWLQWVAVEQKRRLAYLIWMVDTMWRYLHGEDTFLPLQMPDIPLPCAEVLWDARSAKQWRTVIEFADVAPTMKSALKKIFVHREVQSTMGEYSRILLIHGIYRHMWHTKSLMDADSHWSVDNVHQSDMVPSPWSIWPPTHSSYLKWREAVCDCLDTLHWRANSVIGASSALEHPTVLHLHESRIILLTPIDDISAFTHSLLNNDGLLDHASSLLRDRIRLWVEQDRFKARLSVIHAGVTFWHLRRFSVGAFYETHAIVYAALILWIFSVFSERQSDSAFSPETPGTINHAGLNQLPASINLDRPCDDELVQSFIREGTRIPAMIGGVGEIRSPSAPTRILLQAVDILYTFTNWGNTREAARFLSNLSQLDTSQLLSQRAT